MQLKKFDDATLKHQLWEFDVWVTPTLTDIENTQRFQTEMKSVLAVLTALSNSGPLDADNPRFAADLTERTFAYLDLAESALTDSLEKKERAIYFLNSLSRLLFLVTGQSDNNNKCQFPIFLRNELEWSELPGVISRKGKYQIISSPIPSVITSDAIMKRVTDLYVAARSCVAEQASLSGPLNKGAYTLLFEYVACLLDEPKRKKQLAAFVSYFSTCLASNLDAKLLLTPLVRFQIRGSVAATGGHEPEEFLRERMAEWGLQRNIDFNSNDVVLDIKAGKLIEVDNAADEAETPPLIRAKKTRAYDFILPYKTPNWTPRLFIQSQFYAGDSGSVSHKNVDQTETSRRNATDLVKTTWPGTPTPLFVEYVDGAGYSASLNGDLKSLLSFPDTADFIQIRSAPIRLRRLFQTIGFLTPLEVAHAVWSAGGEGEQAVRSNLVDQGYLETEITRGLEEAKQHQYITIDRLNTLSVHHKHQHLVRCYLLLDIIANNGEAFDSIKTLKSAVLVPGFGPYYGLRLAQLTELVESMDYRPWSDNLLMADLAYLNDNGFAILR